MMTTPDKKSIATAATRTAIHESPVDNVYVELDTTPTGLSQDQAKARLIVYGKNIIQEVKGRSLLWKFLSNFTHLMAILLWVGGMVGFAAQMPQLGIAIWLVNIINGLFSFVQEYRAEKAVEELRKLLPRHARVLREGEETNILAEELVPGDIVLLAEGDRISADARLIEANDLKCDQSTLTGESRPVRKTATPSSHPDLAPIEQTNLVFAGTNVEAGTGKAVVIATGMASEFGKIAILAQSQPDETSPLQRELGHVTRTISIMVIIIGAVFFAAAVFVAGVEVSESFIFAMGMIVAFVPEGLLPTVTLTLAMGVQRMAKRNALIKRLSAVETLGCTSVICTDKTGTVTQNEMTVTDLWLGGQNLRVSGVGYNPQGQILQGATPLTGAANPDLRQLLVAAGLCNNARLCPPHDGLPQWEVIGDPTEGAMKVAALKGGVDLAAELLKNPRIRELPFDSHRKRMTTIHAIASQDVQTGRVAYVKGAPHEILDLCAFHIRNGQILDLCETERIHVTAAIDGFARDGLRVLAVAMRQLQEKEANIDDSSNFTPELIEKSLAFLGLVAISDPPRPEVAAAVEKCHQSGIRIVMITGDYGLTAESVARKTGIIQGEHARILTDQELKKMDSRELQEALQGEIIFARAAPELKLRVVAELQKMDHVVAVTGDGVNDSPALKKADIGVAMGIAGTDVAKEAADMVLTDDNFASIVNAIEEGRAVFKNIRKFAVYVFNSNMAEAVPFILFLFSKGAVPLPLTIMQVLSIDLGTDMVPAIGLGSELPESGIMSQPPRPRHEHLLSRRLLIRALLWYGLIEAAAGLTAYFYLNWLNGWPHAPLANGGIVYQMATTMTLAAIVVSQIGAVFNCRTETDSVFKIGFFSNQIILWGIGIELVLLALLIYLPGVHGIFNTAPLGLQEWAFLIMWAPLMFLADELRKLFLRRWSRKSSRQGLG